MQFAFEVGRGTSEVGGGTCEVGGGMTRPKKSLQIQLLFIGNPRMNLHLNSNPKISLLLPTSTEA